jgi:ABC-type nickel/cobalt efflux system permease component RcnA
MDDALLGSIAATGLTVAFLHAALPTHWLPFVLAGRRQGWRRNKTLAIAALAGSGHVLFTIVLGAAIAWFGIAMDLWIGNVFPYIAGGILIAFGVYYLVSGADDHHHFGHAHHHAAHDHAVHDHAHDSGHDHDGHDHTHGRHVHATAQRNGNAQLDGAPPPLSDKTVIVGLLAALTFSPCEGFLPVFVAGAKFGWSGFLVLCVTLAVATLTGMMLLTWLTLLGYQHARFDRFEQHEGKILGGLLMALGLAVLIVEG